MVCSAFFPISTERRFCMRRWPFSMGEKFSLKNEIWTAGKSEIAELWQVSFSFFSLPIFRIFVTKRVNIFKVKIVRIFFFKNIDINWYTYIYIYNLTTLNVVVKHFHFSFFMNSLKNMEKWENKDCNAETTLSNKWRLARFHAITTLNKAVTYFLGELALVRKHRYIFCSFTLKSEKQTNTVDP